MKVYVLELEHGKYYVGKTTNVPRRFKQHLSGSSSIWTRMFRPIRIINIIHECDGLDAVSYTHLTLPTKRIV